MISNNNYMDRLTQKQKEVFDAILSGRKNLSEIGRLLSGQVSRQAIRQRVQQMVAKGYIQKENDEYIYTQEGLDRLLKDGGKTKHSYYDTTTNWSRTLRTDGFIKEAKTTIQPQ